MGFFRFSDYLFDDVAMKLLRENPALAAEFNEKKQSDQAFAADAWAMYAWIYHHSPWYEPSHLRYPVYRLNFMLPCTNN
jgi:hypothetical protein